MRLKRVRTVAVVGATYSNTQPPRQRNSSSWYELVPDAAFAASIQHSGVAEFGIEPEIETASAHTEEGGRHE
jgi:hypothetical protein